MFFHVSRLVSEQCFTALISPSEQSNQPYGLKNRLQKPLFSGSGSTCSGIGIRLFSITQFSVASCTSVKPTNLLLNIQSPLFCISHSPFQPKHYRMNHRSYRLMLVNLLPLNDDIVVKMQGIGGSPQGHNLLKPKLLLKN